MSTPSKIYVEECWKRPLLHPMGLKPSNAGVPSSGVSKNRSSHWNVEIQDLLILGHPCVLRPARCEKFTYNFTFTCQSFLFFLGTPYSTYFESVRDFLEAQYFLSIYNHL